MANRMVEIANIWCIKAPKVGRATAVRLTCCEVFPRFKKGKSRWQYTQSLIMTAVFLCIYTPSPPFHSLTITHWKSIHTRRPIQRNKQMLKAKTHQTTLPPLSSPSPLPSLLLFTNPPPCSSPPPLPPPPFLPRHPFPPLQQPPSTPPPTPPNSHTPPPPTPPTTSPSPPTTHTPPPAFPPAILQPPQRELITSLPTALRWPFRKGVVRIGRGRGGGVYARFGTLVLLGVRGGGLGC